ncbi:MAG TPA: hypothetical protein VFE03_10875, partial [Caulobacteraceae bacterium]|nr:hypothetical protein [Caulobacteraceae bacterium]
GSVEFWALVGGISAIVTAITAVIAVFVGLGQLKIARDLQVMDSTYQSWNALMQAGLANPELVCPNTEEKFAKLMSTPDPRGVGGVTFQDRYAAYGTMMITTSEQIMQMAPDDPYWRFRIEERIRCNAPAIRHLMAEGTYEKRYSCRLRRVIAHALSQPQPICKDDE